MLPSKPDEHAATDLEAGVSLPEVALDALPVYQRLQMEQEIETRVVEARRQVSAGAVTEANADFFEAARRRIKR